MSDLKLAGRFSVREFSITNADKSKTVDIKMLIHTFTIVESMSLSSVRGSAVIYDAFDLVTQFPLKGEEVIKIVYSDFYDTERTEYYQLYSIADVKYSKEASQSMIQYKINFVSLGKFYSENKLIQQSYKPNGSLSLISDYVKDVYDVYYKRLLEENNLPIKNILIIPTTGTQTYVIPSYTPEQTMQFFSRKAFLSGSKTQSFRFFENREMYFFATNEYMYERVMQTATPNTPASGAQSTPTHIPQFRINYGTAQSPDRQSSIMNEIIAIEFGNKTDIISDINEGAYKKKTFEIDIMNNSIIENSYDHSVGFESSTEKLLHDPAYVEKRISKPKEVFVIKDYNSTGVAGGSEIRTDQYYANLYNVKPTAFYHYTANMTSLSIYGRNTIFAGSIIELQLLVNTTDTNDPFKIDKERSGKYIVESIENVFFENVYTQKLTIARGGIGI